MPGPLNQRVMAQLQIQTCSTIQTDTNATSWKRQRYMYSGEESRGFFWCVKAQAWCIITSAQSFPHNPSLFHSSLHALTCWDAWKPLTISSCSMKQSSCTVNTFRALNIKVQMPSTLWLSPLRLRSPPLAAWGGHPASSYCLVSSWGHLVGPAVSCLNRRAGLSLLRSSKFFIVMVKGKMWSQLDGDFSSDRGGKRCVAH